MTRCSRHCSLLAPRAYSIVPIAPSAKQRPGCQALFKKWMIAHSMFSFHVIGFLKTDAV
jgi:hypothetical protein